MVIIVGRRWRMAGVGSEETATGWALFAGR